MVGYYPVDLLRHRPVKTSESCLYMGYRNMHLAAAIAPARVELVSPYTKTKSGISLKSTFSVFQEWPLSVSRVILNQHQDDSLVWVSVNLQKKYLTSPGHNADQYVQYSPHALVEALQRPSTFDKLWPGTHYGYYLHDAAGCCSFLIIKPC